MNNNNSISICQTCNSNDRLFLHNVVFTPKSPPQKICTSCVLQHYHKSICAQCFELYDVNLLTPPPMNATTAGNSRLLRCMRCEHWSHFNCPRPNIPKSPYICPPCMSPNYKYFDFRKPDKAAGIKTQVIDKEASKQLLGAARIAAITMSKAAVMARAEADRKAKEAALARIRAREAIDHVFENSVKAENPKGKENSSGVGPKGVNYVPVRLESNGRNNAGDVEGKNSDGNGNGVIVPAPAPMPMPVAVVIPHQQHNGGENNGVVAKEGGNVGQA